jgi:hypothetical protein
VGFDLSVPFMVFIVAAFLAVVVRWVFRPSRRHTGRPDQGPNADLGLLAPVLASTSRSSALRAKNLLSEQGVRCSLSRLEADRYDVLVFRPDLDRATSLLAS